MTFIQFRFLLPQLILGGLFSSRFYIAMGFSRNYTNLSNRIFSAAYFLLPPNGLLWGYTFFCVLMDIPLPYPYMILTTYLLTSLIDCTIPNDWDTATTNIQRKFWKSFLWLVRVMVVINLALWASERKNSSRANNEKMAQLKYFDGKISRDRK